MLCRSFVVRRTVTFHHSCHRYPSPIHRLGIKLPNSPVPLLHPVPTADYSSSLRSILFPQYGCFVVFISNFSSLILFLSRPFGHFYLVITVYSDANKNLCTSPFVKFFYPTHSFSQRFVGFPPFRRYPPPTFSFVLVQSGSSKTFLHRPFLLPFHYQSPLIINLLETFSHSKFPSSPTPSTSPRCPFNLPSLGHVTSLPHPVELLFSPFLTPSLAIEFLFPIRRTSPIFSYLYNLTNLSHHRFVPVK